MGESFAYLFAQLSLSREPVLGFYLGELNLGQL